jgi:hypothetical protein
MPAITAGVITLAVSVGGLLRYFPEADVHTSAGIVGDPSDNVRTNPLPPKGTDEAS